MTAPRCRWLRFSLRTMFIVVTVAACWLGYQINWIRQRHKFLEEDDPTRSLGSMSGPIFADEQHPPRHPFPLGLRLLGEVPVNAMSVFSADRAEPDRLRALFPEAMIRWSGGGDWNDEKQP